LMGFKYAVGQAVEYTPMGANIALFVVVRQMPEEFQAIDRRYCIKSAQESFERNVMECDLSPSNIPPGTVRSPDPATSVTRLILPRFRGHIG
ncbi:MAG TPA: hypothetical protein VHN11_02340, partial [Xanthobacteraceae bacterium]|nr:hypothetical protein [Xanthobacteraceae bacterium]